MPCSFPGFFGFSSILENNVSPTFAKICCSIFILIIDISGCMLPYLKTDVNTKDQIIHYANAFGIGAMLALGTVHLLQEAVEDLGKHPWEINFHGVAIQTNPAWLGVLTSFLCLIIFEHGIPKSGIVRLYC
eukprot:GHVH01010454.1.p2 GENE.GHVH01010454.1~~GHVH01010454.1.p2  ORF type:complete len:131 (-),score=10.62 GHVH01010454.1:604-996(-)